MNKHTFILPVSILLGCIILGGFYYASVASNDASIERQQQATLQAQEAQQQATLQAQQAQQQATADQDSLVAGEKAACSADAQKDAVSEYESSSLCTGIYTESDCTDGKTYLVAQYNSAYETCLESKGLQ